MWYWVKTSRFVRWLFPHFVWKMPAGERLVYLTFDDGPIPGVTDWVLEQLEQFQAKATFFCIGENVNRHRTVYDKIRAQGHSIGNHTQTHANGWKTDSSEYIQEFEDCQAQLDTKTTLFRPPYGKIRRSQRKQLEKLGTRIIMWDVLSADFDTQISPENCLENVLNNIEDGSIVIFHDSLKAEKNLRYALPRTLEFLQQKGFKAVALTQTCS
ncbi:polysaccharide deacetylase family protein [Flavobacterium aurantiibacter]|uniref:Polysaccharide deacetylase family protein n=1 Tax=Flavobacterium aurantiibacter TaxID=2023067 RepID=A0A255ZY93_9FLAO|nr:polysaccharide deacetylase family protein [Flavobacterium aurantiibacter]OYQ46463.1 polysaccharide deacetylase family protein [Flavobacterium aurantiibacter]